MSSASDELKAKITEVEGKIKDLEEQLKQTADAQERNNVSGRLTAYINLLATYQASYQAAAATGGGAGTSAVNFDARAAQALFSCFDEVPMLLDRDIITTMLQTPVARAVEDASSNSRYSSDVVWGQLFVTTAPAAPGVMPSTQLVQRYTDVLYTVLSGVAEAVPPAGCNEAAWYTFYGKLLDDVFNLASQLLGLRFKVRRDQVDTSITKEDKVRDLLVYSENVMLYGGEDKHDREPLPVDELRSKHRGASAAQYGSLHYVLLHVTAGAGYQLYAGGSFYGAPKAPPTWPSCAHGPNSLAWAFLLKA